MGEWEGASEGGDLAEFYGTTKSIRLRGAVSLCMAAAAAALVICASVRSVCVCVCVTCGSIKRNHQQREGAQLTLSHPHHPGGCHLSAGAEHCVALAPLAILRGRESLMRERETLIVTSVH